MAGGRIAYKGEHKIVLASGDYHWDGVYAPKAIAQNPKFDYGKVIEIDLKTKAHKQLTRGNRNMQGIVVDHNKQIWTVEHGPRGGDELNRIVEGNNYGWPLQTLGTRYNRTPWPTALSYGRHDKFTAPTYSWVPSIATSNITRIENFHPGWDNDLLIGTLKVNKLYRLRLRDNRVVFAEPILVAERVRYVHQHTDGRIALWTDSHNLMFISPAKADNSAEVIDNIIASGNYSSSQKNKINAVLQRCNECHSFGTTNHAQAPALGAIFGAPIAKTPFPAYSDGLKSKGGNWTAVELKNISKIHRNMPLKAICPIPPLRTSSFSRLSSRFFPGSGRMPIQRPNQALSKPPTKVDHTGAPPGIPRTKALPIQWEMRGDV